jgi:uncharacterized protein YggT (Ycf19 family)
MVILSEVKNPKNCFTLAASSWFPVRDDNPILSFVCMVTEPFVAPIRALFDKMGWFRNFPLDMSFFVAFVLVSMLDSILLLF